MTRDQQATHYNVACGDSLTRVSGTMHDLLCVTTLSHDRGVTLYLKVGF